MYCRLLKALLVIVLLLSASVSHVQETSAQPAAPPAPVVVERSIEDLNLLGGAVSNPPFADTILGADSGFRRGMFEHGIALRANLVPRGGIRARRGNHAFIPPMRPTGLPP